MFVKYIEETENVLVGHIPFFQCSEAAKGSPSIMQTRGFLAARPAAVAPI
jgi:hypothetical protein